MRTAMMMTIAVCVAILSADVAVAEPTAEARCAAGMNDAAGKYDLCAAKAEKGLVSTGDMTKYADALVKCESKLVDKWTKLEAGAVDAGTACPSMGDQVPIQNFVDACVQSVALAVGGGALGPDPVTCNADLGACTADLGVCGGDLVTCSGNLASTNADLGTCTGDLGTCNGSLTSCSNSLSTTNADLGLCNTNLSTTNADLVTCSTELGACEQDLATCQASIGERSPVLRTGQTTCYDAAGATIGCAGTGQDGELRRGVARSFTDNGNGTITDDITGLMWEKLSDDGTVHDYNNAYAWEAAFTGKIATLNSDGFAGHHDWRLPNITELETLVNLGAHGPATLPPFSTGCAPGCTVETCSCTRPDDHHMWSSTTIQMWPVMAWAVHFIDGAVLGSEKFRSWGVRAVRAGSKSLKTGQTLCYDGGGQIIGCAGTGQDGEALKGVARSFADNGDGTITDEITGLMWEALDNNNGGGIHDMDNSYSWATAMSSKIATLNSQNFAGHADWRLPNLHELRTLVNHGAIAPSVYGAFNASCTSGCSLPACSCTTSVSFWSSSTNDRDPSLAWVFNFQYGGDGAPSKGTGWAVRAVRAGY